MVKITKMSVAAIVLASLLLQARPIAAAEPYEVNVSLGLTGQGALVSSQIRVRGAFAEQLRTSDIQPELDIAFKFGIIPKVMKATDLIARSTIS